MKEGHVNFTADQPGKSPMALQQKRIKITEDLKEKEGKKMRVTKSQSHIFSNDKQAGGGEEVLLGWWMPALDQLQLTNSKENKSKKATNQKKQPFELSFLSF